MVKRSFVKPGRRLTGLRESEASTYEEAIELWRGYIEALHAMLIECQFLLKVYIAVRWWNKFFGRPCSKERKQ
jgi:hypothetical protein